MKHRFGSYVHEFVSENGGTFYAVGEWRNGHYECPLDSRERRLTGCYAEFGPLSYMPRFVTRRQALRRARTLFAPVELEY